MSLLEAIKADLTKARKSKNSLASAVLSTLYSEAVMVGKNKGTRETTAAETLGKVRAFIKNIAETLKSLPGGHAQIESMQQEKTLLQNYLPQQLTEDGLKDAIRGIGDHHEKSIKSMGKIMAELKARHDGAYDGKLASNLVKKFLMS